MFLHERSQFEWARDGGPLTRESVFELVAVVSTLGAISPIATGERFRSIKWSSPLPSLFGKGDCPEFG